MIFIDFLYSIVGYPLGFIMWIAYLLVNNFGWAIIIFTLIIKAAMFPIFLKQQRNMAVSQLFMPRIKEIQTKYRNNKEKQQEELTKLQKEGYNPMGGCLPMLLTFVLLFGVIDVVYKPMTHLEHFEWTEQGSINNIVLLAKEADIANTLMASEADREIVIKYKTDPAALSITEQTPQVVLAEGFDMAKSKEAITSINNDDRQKFGNWTIEQLNAMIAKESRLSQPVKADLQSTISKYGMLQKELFSVQMYKKHPEAFKESNLISNKTEIFEKLDRLDENMTFMGLDLGKTPTLSWDWLIVIPIMSFLFSILQMAITQIIQRRQNPGMKMGGGMNIILYIMPLFSLYIAFVVPAGVGFYWAISYVFGIAQSLVIAKFFPNKKLAAEAEAKMKAKGKNLEATATVVDVDEEGNKTERFEKISDMSQKEIKEYNRKKLEEARKADALKYGEDYDDED